MYEHEHIEQIRLDYLNGMTYKAIAKKYMIDQRTAKRYVEENLPLCQLEHRPYASKLDPYESFIRKTLADYEMDFCRHRMPGELLLVEMLMTGLFESIYRAIGDENYDAFQKKLPPAGAFKGMSEDDVRRAGAAVMRCANGDFENLVGIMEE